ncbi:hypothetical protein ACHAWF_000468, partial [Thalassiosira exigua]
MPRLIERFRLSCGWLDYSCSMSLYTGPSKASMISPCGLLLSSMQCGST